MTTPTNSIAIFEKCNLPARALTSYEKSINAFRSAFYHSAAGNAYGELGWFVGGMFIKADVGKGYCHTFLNGLYVYDARTGACLASHVYPMYDGAFFSTDLVRQVTIGSLVRKAEETCRKRHQQLDVAKLRSMLTEMVNRDMTRDQLMVAAETRKALGY